MAIISQLVLISSVTSSVTRIPHGAHKGFKRLAGILSDLCDQFDW
jgi:hypothetical protein